MKKIYLLLLFLAPSLNSCFEPFGGSGNIIEDEQKIDSPCYIIEYNTEGKLYIIPSNDYKIIVKTDDNIASKININQLGPRLIIEDKTDISPTILEFYLYIPDITEVEINGSGDVIIDDNINQGRSGFYLNSNGSGNFFARDLSADEIELKLNGSGDIEFTSLNVIKGIDIINSGSGDVNIHSLNSSESSHNLLGSGNINILNGNIQTNTTILTGSGEINSVNCPVNIMFVHSSGSGDSYVWATDYLEVVIKGSGDVIYKGEPELKYEINGSGKLRKF